MFDKVLNTPFACSVTFLISYTVNPTDKYMFKVNHRNTRISREICSKLTIMTPELRQWPRSGVFIVNSEHI